MTEYALPPCQEKAGSPEHEWELMLRCSRCGFLIRVEHTCHYLPTVKALLLVALHRLHHNWGLPCPSNVRHLCDMMRGPTS